MVKMAFHHFELGIHRGIPVVADFPCGDICPNYTVRIIHYDIAPGPECLTRGGILRSIKVIKGIAQRDTPFCFRWTAYKR